MRERSREARALAGMEVFVVLSRGEEDGACWVVIETTRDVASCPSCEARELGMAEARSSSKTCQWADDRCVLCGMSAVDLS
jgi:hypothetical protein